MQMPTKNQELISKATNRLFSRLGRKIPAEMAVEWGKMFSDMPDITLELFGSACKRVLEDPDVDPYKLTPAKLLSYITRPQLDTKARANQSWDLVIDRLERRGIAAMELEYPAYGDPMKKALQRVGGLARLGRTDYGELKWLKREFIDAYVNYLPFSEDTTEFLPEENKKLLGA